MNPPSKLKLNLDSLSSSRQLTQQTSQYWLSRSAKNPRIDWQYVILISSVLVVHNRRQRFCWAAATLYLRFSGGAGVELSVWSSQRQSGAFKKAIRVFTERHTWSQRSKGSNVLKETEFIVWEEFKAEQGWKASAWLCWISQVIHHHLDLSTDSLQIKTVSQDQVLSFPAFLKHVWNISWRAVPESYFSWSQNIKTCSRVASV